MPVSDSPVLIAGRGLTGLTTALFLAWHGVPHVLVERQGDPAPGALPMALNPRTMELFRSTGLEAPLRLAAASPQDFSQLGCPWPSAGQRSPWLAHAQAHKPEGRTSFSPCQGILAAQSAVAAVLRARAEALGSHLRVGVRLAAFESEAEGLRAVLEHPITGRQDAFRVQYLVVAVDSRDEPEQWRSKPAEVGANAEADGGAPPFTARFQSGRAYFVGRAARTLPFPALFALNLDLQEAHNLAWKLAYVVQGQAGPALLDTYEAERQPLIESVARGAGAGGDGGRCPPGAFARIFGHRYRSAAVVRDAEEAPGEEPERPGRIPGTRVPHIVLQRGPDQVSTLDLCGGDFVLLAGAGGQAWVEAAERAASTLAIDLEAYCIGEGHDLSTRDWRWPANFGMTESGALLIRPDGYVGWRARAALPYPEHVLIEVLARLLCRENVGPARTSGASHQ
jgi:2-polyprenyl-6-methoxyphenol hydroxylase-like FAD-dependent oxidoreductase